MTLADDSGQVTEVIMSLLGQALYNGRVAGRHCWRPALQEPDLKVSHSSGSSTQKRPHEKRGRGLIQNESDLLDTDLLPIRTAVESPSCVKLHQ
jgi:hypothetical protein